MTIPVHVLNQLHYVKVDDPEIDLQHFPDFMIIGPQRTGTTWLYENLSFHPQIKLAVPKELFFFNNLNRPKDPKFRSEKLDWYLSFFHEGAFSQQYQKKQRFCRERFAEPYEPVVRGEATASYSVLDEKIIHEIALLNPHLRIIMLIRNPIDRAWSHAKKDLGRDKGRRVEEVTSREFETFFNLPYQRKCAQYTQNINRWLSCFDERAIFIRCFDDIQKRPSKLLLEVMTFLGVRADHKYILPSANKLIEATEPVEMPPAYRMMLQSVLSQDIRNLEDRFGVHWD